MSTRPAAGGAVRVSLRNSATNHAQPLARTHTGRGSDVVKICAGLEHAGFVLNVEAVNARLGRVLVVEDDPGIATQMVRGLTRAGYETGSVTTGKAALDWPVPDVVLLDLGLPDIDGVEVCRRLRQSCDAAIIIVSARGEESDRVLALDEGADDYLIKPFGLQELLARIRAVLRRSRQPAGHPQVLHHGPLTVDLRTHKVSVNGNQIA